MKNNWKTYKERVEPTELKQDSGYINLRTCMDLEVLGRLESLLGSCPEDSVIVPWISRPFGTVEGYGIYTKQDAKNLSRRSKEEFWGDPRVGFAYDLDWIRRRIDKASKKDYVTASK